MRNASTPRAAVSAAAARAAAPLTVASSDGKKTVIITGTSSGIGLHAAKHLARSGKWHIVCANRDMSKTLVRTRGA